MAMIKKQIGTLPPKAILKLSPDSYPIIEEMLSKTKSEELFIEELHAIPSIANLTLDDKKILAHYLIETRSSDIHIILKQLFAFYSVSRKRDGLTDCYAILKSWESGVQHTWLLPHVLDTIKAIGIEIPDKDLKK